MAKKQSKKNASAPNRGFHSVTLREENTGRKRFDAHTMLKLQHLQGLATWAGGEVSIPSLAAHYGRLLAANAELEGIPLDRSIVSCQRCETIFQPGYNCTIRIEKNASSLKHRGNSGTSQNNVVYACHFCSYKNLRKGTPKGHMKDLFAAGHRRVSESNIVESMTTKVDRSFEDVKAALDLRHCKEHGSGSSFLDVKGSPKKEVARDIPTKDNPKTPSTKVTEKKLKMTGSGLTKSASGSTYTKTGPGKDSGSSGKRKRKGWSGLREITLSSERQKEQRMNNLAIPFHL